MFIYCLGEGPFVNNESCDLFTCRHGKGSFVNNESCDLFMYHLAGGARLQEDIRHVVAPVSSADGQCV